VCIAIVPAAPRQYASKLAGLLIDAGGQPLWVPGVSVSRLVEQQHLQQVRHMLGVTLQRASQPVSQSVSRHSACRNELHRGCQPCRVTYLQRVSALEHNSSCNYEFRSSYITGAVTDSAAS
jgi:hypothetical protein